MARFTDHEVIVVGAGLAGCTAAAELKARGFDVALLEAQERLGGRALSAPFSQELPDVVEYGGGWIAPWQDEILATATGLGLTLEPRAVLSDRVFHDGNARHKGTSSAWPSSAEFTVAMAQIAEDARAMKAGDTALEPLSLSAYIALRGFSAQIVTQIMAWWRMSGSANPDEASVADLLRFAGYVDCTLEGMVDSLGYTVAGGIAQIAARQIEQAGIASTRRAPVVAIRPMDTKAMVTLRSGASLTASGVVVALGVNALSSIDLPAEMLTPAQSRAIGNGHVGRACKLLISARGVEPGALATGGTAGFEFLYADKHMSDGSCLIVAFGPGEALEGLSDGEVAHILKQFFPMAELAAWACHDWLSDPWARGTWATPMLGQEDDFAWDHWAPQSRIAFASSDFAPAEAGWFAGALRCGRMVAEDMASRLPK